MASGNIHRMLAVCRRWCSKLDMHHVPRPSLKLRVATVHCVEWCMIVVDSIISPVLLMTKTRQKAVKGLAYHHTAVK